MKLIIRWICIALAVALAVKIVPGVGFEGGSSFWTLVAVAAVIGLVNAILGPVLKILSFPALILSLGLMSIVIDALLLKFAAWISNGMFDAGFYVNGFWPAIFASLIISIVTSLLWGILGGDEDKKKSKA